MASTDAGINELGDIRSEIDRIDAELLRLLNERAEIGLRVGAAKTEADRALCDHRREREVLARVASANAGPLDDKGIERIFGSIIDESLQLQQRTYHSDPTADVGQPAPDIAGSRIAYLGEPGTFSHEAASAVGQGSELVSVPTFDDLFRALGDGKADHVVVPLENTIVGSVHRCYDLLLASDLKIVAEVILPIAHYLIAHPDAEFDDLKTVASHPAALAQCERFFAANPHLERVAGDDTAGCVKRAVESGDVTQAGIGSLHAAELYGGRVLREHVEDHSSNYTRFALLSAEGPGHGSGDKVSLVLTLRHEPGSLHRALRAFVRRNIDLLKIESRPVRDAPERFYFYVDVRMPEREAELASALEEIGESAADVRYLGRYSTIAL